MPGLFSGSVEVQERRPRSWNEPRRKRLAFVKSRSKSKNRRNPSDDWAVVPHPGQQRGRRLDNDVNNWDLRQWEAQNRFNQQDFHRVNMAAHRLRIEQERHILALPAHLRPQIHQQQGHPGQHHGQHGHGHGHGHDGHGQGRHEQHQLHEAGHHGSHSGHSDTEDSDSGHETLLIADGSDDGHSVRVHRGHPRPHRILRLPERSHNHRDFPAIIPLGRRGRSRSRGRRDSHGRHGNHGGYHAHSPSSYDSSDSESEATYVLAMPRGYDLQGLHRGRSHSRSHSHARSHSRPARITVVDEYDSDDSLRDWQRRHGRRWR